LVKAYQAEQAIRELRTRLAEIFNPVNRWCYQRVLALPAVDEIELEQEQVTLIITEPHPGLASPRLLDGPLAQRWPGSGTFGRYGQE
jgi:hypothetical protein